MIQHPMTSTNWISALFVVCFVMLTFFALVMVQIGVPASSLALVLLALVIGCYIFTALYGGTLKFVDFYFAGKSSSPLALGQTIAAGVISSAVYVLLAGQFYEFGTNGLAYYWGWLVGVAFICIMFAAKYNRAQLVSISDLVPTNSLSAKVLRSLIALAIFISSGLFLYSQLHLLGVLGEASFGLSQTIAIYVMIFCLTFTILMGGIRSLSLSRMAALPIILISFVTPLIWISVTEGNGLFPFFSYGSAALEQIREVETQLVDAGLQTREDIFDFTSDAHGFSWFSSIATLAVVAMGTASMPQLIQQIGIVKKPAQARRGAYWAFVILLLFILLVPSVTAFVKLDLYNILLGLQVADLRNEASWIFSLSGDGIIQFISICGQLVSSVDEVITACGQSEDYFLTQKDFDIDYRFMVFALPALHNVPPIISAIFAVGAMFALMTTADGLFFAMTSAVSRDIVRPIIKPKASNGVQMFLFRIVLVVLAIVLCLAAPIELLDPLLAFQLSLTLGALVLFPVLFVQLSLKQIQTAVLFAGIAAGLCCYAVLIYWITTNTEPKVLINLGLLTNQQAIFESGFISLLVVGLVISAAHQYGLLRTRLEARKSQLSRLKQQVEQS